MINILSVDTSQDLCSAALSYNDIIDEIRADSPIERSKKLLSMISDILQKMPISSLDALAFAAGPGSLTGLKVASCIMQGLKLTYEKPIIKISSLQAMAFRGYQQFQFSKIMSCIDAKMGQVYYGLYEFKDISQDNCLPATMHQDQLVQINQIPILDYMKQGILVVGSGISLIEKQLGVKLNPHLSLDIRGKPENIRFTASDIIKLANSWYKKYGIIVDDANPIYLRAYD
jgi:tRNA threonylcarbamoyladenosine biosynthesis protein TsaB